MRVVENDNSPDHTGQPFGFWKRLFVKRRVFIIAEIKVGKAYTEYSTLGHKRKFNFVRDAETGQELEWVSDCFDKVIEGKTYKVKIDKETNEIIENLGVVD